MRCGAAEGSTCCFNYLQLYGPLILSFQAIGVAMFLFFFKLEILDSNKLCPVLLFFFYVHLLCFNKQA